MRAWSCVTSYYSPLHGSHCHTLDTVNPAMGMMLCSSMRTFEKVYYNKQCQTKIANIVHATVITIKFSHQKQL